MNDFNTTDIQSNVIKVNQIKRKSYTLRDKLNALKLLKEFNGNISKTSRGLNVDRKQLRVWRENESKIVNSNNKQKSRRCPDGGRKPFWQQLENILFCMGKI